MSIFTTAIGDIFAHTDFCETCIIGDAAYDCICTAQPDASLYTDAGLVQDTVFSLRIQMPIAIPKNGSPVIFRDTKYKVLSSTIDSANTSVTIDIQALSKP